MGNRHLSKAAIIETLHIELLRARARFDGAVDWVRKQASAQEATECTMHAEDIARSVVTEPGYQIVRVFRGRAAPHFANECEWWALHDDDEAGNLSGDAAWLDGLEGHDVELRVIDHGPAKKGVSRG